MFDRWLLERRRLKAAAQTSSTDLKNVLESALPSASLRFSDVRFLCLDFETTGLQPSMDSILSIGSVMIEGGQIRADSAQYDVIAFDGVLDEKTLTIHGLTHDALQQGISLHDAIKRLLQRAAGAVCVAHSAAIEKGFLDAYCRAHLRAPFEALWVCTLELERKRLAAQRNDASVRLGQTRARYNLPRYTAHHALIDALAGAELLLAQAAHRSGANCRLKDLL